MNTNSLGNSLSWAGGIYSTFLSSSFLWTKGFSRLTSLSVFAIVFLLSCSSMRWSWHFFHFVFTESRALAVLPCEGIVRASDRTNDISLQSFVFLIGWVCILYEFYACFSFLCKSQYVYKIKWFITHDNTVAKAMKALELHYPMIQFLIHFYHFIFIVLVKEKIDVLASTQ